MTSTFDVLYNSGFEKSKEISKKKILKRLSQGDFYDLVSKYAKEDTDFVCNEIVKMIMEGME